MTANTRKCLKVLPAFKQESLSEPGHQVRHYQQDLRASCLPDRSIELLFGSSFGFQPYDAIPTSVLRGFSHHTIVIRILTLQHHSNLSFMRFQSSYYKLPTPSPQNGTTQTRIGNRLHFSYLYGLCMGNLLCNQV